MRTLGRWLRSLNPTVVVGIGLLTTGLAIALAAVTLPAGLDPKAKLLSALAGSVSDVVQFLFRTSEHYAEQQSFNRVVVGELLGQLPAPASSAIRLLMSYLSRIFTPWGLISIPVLLVGCALARRAFEMRHPVPEPNSDGRTE